MLWFDMDNLDNAERGKKRLQEFGFSCAHIGAYFSAFPNSFRDGKNFDMQADLAVGWLLANPETRQRNPSPQTYLSSFESPNAPRTLPCVSSKKTEVIDLCDDDEEEESEPDVDFVLPVKTAKNSDKHEHVEREDGKRIDASSEYDDPPRQGRDLEPVTLESKSAGSASLKTEGLSRSSKEEIIILSSDDDEDDQQLLSILGSKNASIVQKKKSSTRWTELSPIGNKRPNRLEEKQIAHSSDSSKSSSSCKPQSRDRHDALSAYPPAIGPSNTFVRQQTRSLDSSSLGSLSRSLDKHIVEASNGKSKRDQSEKERRKREREETKKAEKQKRQRQVERRKLETKFRRGELWMKEVRIVLDQRLRLEHRVAIEGIMSDHKVSMRSEILPTEGGIYVDVLQQRENALDAPDEVSQRDQSAGCWRRHKCAYLVADGKDFLRNAPGNSLGCPSPIEKQMDLLAQGDMNMRVNLLVIGAMQALQSKNLPAHYPLQSYQQLQAFGAELNIRSRHKRRVWHLVSSESLADYIYRHAKGIAQMEHEEATDSVHLVRFDKTRGERRTLKASWTNYLKEIPGMGEKAHRIVEAFGSFRKLSDAYIRCGSDQKKKEELLKDLRHVDCRGNAIGKKLGPKLSKMVYTCITSIDPNEPLG
eukprot:CAMPEP_0114488910 /NCGR_PEP_ID=MMETSP0109-20121206/1591_1 /TAXON_ID=29199 /ORGANISM="Chlorarachnion reptans, Strain CCCM449" /LENGTH=645 /DNA_ID=CAMNT_0001665353 /DNA_START=22 /DNA_END=1959 /DNA_ORIENTATION=-